MNNFMLFLHVVGTAGLGYYVLLPFLVGRASHLAGAGQEGLADGLTVGNRIAQYALVLQLLTGGYLVSQADYTVLWMVLAVVLFLAIGAVGGILSKPLKRIAEAIREGRNASEHIARSRTLSIVLFLLVLAILYLMQYPQ